MKRNFHTVGRRGSACAFIVQLSSVAQSKSAWECASVKNFAPADIPAEFAKKLTDFSGLCPRRS